MQTGPLVNDSAPYRQHRNCLTVKKCGRKPQACALFHNRQTEWLRLKQYSV
jgi:hypothetical protein